MRLKGKVAIITGSSRGIGLGIAEGFIKAGAKVAICGSSVESAQRGADELIKKYPNADILPIELNISNVSSVQEGFKTVFDKFKNIDILLNNAGIVKGGPINTLTEKEFEEVLNINTMGPFRCIKEATKYMKSGSSIINISSITGLYGSPGSTAYATSKAGVIGLTKSLARELAPSNIRVNVICPGVIETDMTSDLPEESMAYLKQLTPIGRFGKPEDLAGMCVHLASDESLFTTNAVISIDGGALF